MTQQLESRTLQSPLVSFQSVEEFRFALTTMGPIDDTLFDSLIHRRLPPIISAAAFGTILGINPKLLTAMAKFPVNYYQQFTISKKSGGQRIILAPRTFLKTVQYYIAKHILNPHPWGPHVMGFVKSRGIVDNGLVHKAARHLLNADIKDFFGSITERQVRESFQTFGFNAEVSRLLTGLCTYGGVLPQGAPTSPGLSNLVFSTVDAEILNLCTPRLITYSRYADDLTFSSVENIPREFLENLSHILSRYGFQLNRQKIRFAGPGQAKYVTGLVVNEKVHPPRELRRRLRAIFHQAKMKPENFSKQAKVILGWASFVNSYDHVQGAEYLKIARSVDKD